MKIGRRARHRSATCSRSVHHDLGAYALGALDSVARDRFREHLTTCLTCAAELRSLAPVLELLRRVDDADLVAEERFRPPRRFRRHH